MLLKKKKITNGLRHQVLLKKFLLCKRNKVCKTLLKGKKKFYGRGFGRITVHHKGGGTKHLFRRIDSLPLFSISIGIFYDPNRNSFISLQYDLLKKRFLNTLATSNVYSGTLSTSFMCYPQYFLSSVLSLQNVPVGSLIHSISSDNHFIYIKSAGVFGIVIQKNVFHCKIKLPSGTIKTFPLQNFCVLGRVSNVESNLTVLGKAGKSRLRNRRPKVRGVAMNPVDHPHGGQTSGGIPSVTPWGIPTKGKPTRKKYGKK
jgi:large subunit ribosomal protein L2